MSTQPSLFPDLISDETPVDRSPRVARDYDPMTDMWGENPLCPKCQGKLQRLGAYINCSCGYCRFMECFGNPDHPKHEAFVAYRCSIGHPIEE
jgi:hypothetical protein